jgi:hypothetical protein
VKSVDTGLLLDASCRARCPAVMVLHETCLQRVCEIHLDSKSEGCGLFACCWCHRECDTSKLNPELAQWRSFQRGMLPGIRYQASKPAPGWR